MQEHRALRVAIRGQRTDKGAGQCIRNFFIASPQILPPLYPTSSSLLHIHIFNVPFSASVCSFFTAPRHPFICLQSFIQCHYRKSDQFAPLPAESTAKYPGEKVGLTTTSASQNTIFISRRSTALRNATKNLGHLIHIYSSPQLFSFWAARFEFVAIFDEWNNQWTSSVPVATTSINNPPWRRQACHFRPRTSALLCRTNNATRFYCIATPKMQGRTRTGSWFINRSLYVCT